MFVINDILEDRAKDRRNKNKHAQKPEFPIKWKYE